MNKEIYLEKLKQFECPKWNDLPDFEIYMDQVIFFINDRLNNLYFEEDKKDKVITSNMVNNYVKNSLVHPPIKKHYKQYHLAFLIAVSILKRCFSLAEITRFIEIEQAMDAPSISLVYDSFSSCFDHYLHQIIEYGFIKDEYFLENPKKEQALMANIVKTVVFKIYTELEVLDFDKEKE